MGDKLNLNDSDTRKRLVNELNYSFFVEAGAGAGKTTTLISRIVSIVMAGVAKPEEIVAITFTEAAAGELKEKLFSLLQVKYRESELTLIEKENLKYAIDHIEDFVLSTIHGFAYQILSRYSTEANIPFSFKVISNDYEIYRLYEEIDFNIKQHHTEFLAVIQRAYDLGDTNVANWILGLINLLSKKDLQNVNSAVVHKYLLKTVDDILINIGNVKKLIGSCKDHSDSLFEKTELILNEIDDLNLPDRNFDTEETNPIQIYSKFARLGSIKMAVGNSGLKNNWPGDSKPQINSEVKALKSNIESFKSYLFKLLVYEVVNKLVELHQNLLSEGFLNFDDLLSCSVRLLKEVDWVRRDIGRQFKYLAVDEYQDTDDLQTGLLDLIIKGAKEANNDLKLFYVGDPKQSIYAFRNANLALYHLTRKQFTENLKDYDKCEEATLVSNFRSQEPIINWVNHHINELFSLDSNFTDIKNLVSTKPPHVISEFKDNSVRKVFYLTYKETDPVETISSDHKDISINTTKKEAKSKVKVGTLRKYSSESIARTIRYLVDNKVKLNPGSDSVLYSDIAIIVPSRTSVPQIASALEAYSIPIKYELKNDIFQSSIIKSVIHLLKVILDPVDLISWTGLLQDLPNCLSESELYNFIDKFNGTKNVESDPNLSDNKIIQLVLYYNELCQRLPFDQVFDEILETFYISISALFYPRYRFEINKLNNFIYLIYEFVQSGNPTLARLLNWIDYLRANSASFEDALILEDDYDAVRLVTIHAAKGLEYGVVFLSGLKNLESTSEKSPLAECCLGENGEYNVEVQLNKDVNTKLLSQNEIDFEAIRKLYVAATRAKDLLFLDFADCFQLLSDETDETKTVSKQLTEIDSELKSISIISQLYNSISPEELSTGDVEKLLGDFRPLGIDTVLSENTNIDARNVLTQVAQRKSEIDCHLDDNRIVTPSKLNRKLTLAGIANSIEDNKLDFATLIPVSSRGLMGTSIGTAVHKVLETLDFSKLYAMPTNDSQNYVDRAVSAAVVEFKIETQKSTVLKMVNNALQSETISKAMQCKHYKETYIGLPILTSQGRRVLLEGFVDLLIETDDGLIIVDFKTTGLTDEADFEGLTEDYEPQGLAYAYGVGVLTGKRIVDVVFLILNNNGWREIKISLNGLHDRIVNFPLLLESYL